MGTVHERVARGASWGPRPAIQGSRALSNRHDAVCLREGACAQASQVSVADQSRLRAKLKGLTVARVLEVRLGTIALSPADAFVLRAGQSLENPVT